MTKQQTDSIIDTSKPNAGRMYDYYLGGNHNFDIDRQAAEQIISLLPFVPKASRLQRWCLQDLAVELTQNKAFDIIIDFASGLPTQDHIHHVVPEGTTVIYSDIDPITVEYGRQILEGTANTYYFQADARQPEALVNRIDVQKIIGDQRDVALVYWGVSAFIDDKSIRHAARYLYEWSGKNACLAFMAQAANLNASSPNMQGMATIYEQIGVSIYFRTLEAYKQLLLPWRPESPFIPMLTWHGLDQSLVDEPERDVWGPGDAGYGTYLIK